MILNNYAWLLAASERSTAGQRAEALTLVSRAVEFRPDNDSFRATLALAYAANGQTNASLETAREVVGRLAMSGQSKLLDDLRRNLAKWGVAL